MRKNTKGITLIALVITIIVLLILAAISIAALTGNNGILTNAQKSRRQTSESEAKERINLLLNSLKTEVYARQVNNKRYSGLTTDNQNTSVTGIDKGILDVINGDLGLTGKTGSKPGVDAPLVSVANKETAKVDKDAQITRIKAESDGWHIYLDGATSVPDTDTGSATGATETVTPTAAATSGYLTIAYKDTANDFYSYGVIRLSNSTALVELDAAESGQLTTD